MTVILDRNISLRIKSCKQTTAEGCDDEERDEADIILGVYMRMPRNLRIGCGGEVDDGSCRHRQEIWFEVAELSVMLSEGQRTRRGVCTRLVV